MKRKISVLTILVLALLGGSIHAIANRAVAANEAPYEVWAIDQSDTAVDGGGTLYIYEGGALTGQNATTAVPEVIDLGGSVRSFCLSQTGTAPQRPHMVLFNAAHTHALIPFVGTGHVLFMDAAHRTPITCLDVGLQAHAAFPSRDQTYVVVANQNGKLLQRIMTDYASNTFTLDNAATLNLATCVTPNGLACQDARLRPDNAPICPIIDASSRFTVVTLRGGGVFVVDSTATPMAIVAEYDRATIHPNGCGGVEVAGKMYVNAGGGTPGNPFESDLYALPMSTFTAFPNPPNTPAPTIVFSNDGQGEVDSHGALLTKQGRYIWVADRAANRIVVVDPTTDAVVNEFDLAGAVSSDPAPDLMDISPSGNRVFVTLRGPHPLTANAHGHENAVGNTPGVGIVRVEQNGRRGVLQAVARLTHVVDGIERADPHGVRVRPK